MWQINLKGYLSEGNKACLTPNKNTILLLNPVTTEGLKKIPMIERYTASAETNPIEFLHVHWHANPETGIIRENVPSTYYSKWTRAVGGRWYQKLPEGVEPARSWYDSNSSWQK